MTTAATLTAISAIGPALTSRPDPIAFRGLVEGLMNATAQCWHLPVSVAFALVRRWLVLCLT
jgi:hypothetical protein